MTTRNFFPKRIVMLLLSMFMFLNLNSAVVLADSYNVTASVPYDPPTVAATVESPTANNSVSSNNVDITGTCQILSPPTIISVWNGPTLLGSTPCQVGGNYSINVALYEGINVLTIRSSNTFLLYGPDSSPFIITYTPAIPVSTPQAAAVSPTGPINNPQTSGELLITSTTPFGVTNNNNSVSITITVKGGDKPYTLLINWGDGTTESQQLSAEGDYVYTHVYDKPAIYNVLVTLTDVLGKSRTFSWVVTSEQIPAIQSPAAGKVPSGTEKVADFRSYTYFAIFALILFILVVVFLFGRYYQTTQSDKPIPKNILKKPRVLR